MKAVDCKDRGEENLVDEKEKDNGKDSLRTSEGIVGLYSLHSPVYKGEIISSEKKSPRAPCSRMVAAWTVCSLELDSQCSVIQALDLCSQEKSMPGYCSSCEETLTSSIWYWF